MEAEACARLSKLARVQVDLKHAKPDEAVRVCQGFVHHCETRQPACNSSIAGGRAYDVPPLARRGTARRVADVPELTGVGVRFCFVRFVAQRVAELVGDGEWEQFVER